MNLQDAVLYKHVLAIHSGSKLSLLDRKICNALLITCFHNPDDEDNQIQVSHLLKIIGIVTRNYHQIYLSINRLASTVIEWGILKKDSFKGNLTGISFLQMYNINNGLITFRIAKELKSLLLSPNQYAPIRMSTVAAMSSSFGLALYENCASYIGMGETGWISIEEFKHLMGVGDKYSVYNDLKKRVIKTAINDVNKNSDFKVSLVERKERRKTAKIKFTILSNRDVKSEKTFQSLKEFGVPKAKINQFKNKFSKDYINEKLGYVKKYPNAHNKTGLLISAIENGYKVIPEPAKVERVDIKKIENEYVVYKSQLIEDWVKSLSKDRWDTISKCLINQVKDSNFVLFQEFVSNLPNKIFLNDKNIKQDAFAIIETYFKTLPDNWKAPKLLNWQEWVRQSCQHHL